MYKPNPPFSQKRTTVWLKIKYQGEQASNRLTMRLASV
jgi:hypothetical protein